MKSFFDSMLAAAMVVALATLLGGCGQRGPLYLPGSQPPANAQEEAVKPSPVPTSSIPASSK